MSTASRARYAPTSASVGQARRFTARWADEEGMGEAADDVALVVSELAANAVLHARTDFEVHLSAVDDGVRAEVWDGSATMPLAGPLSQLGVSGRGLPLVQAVAARWGVEAASSGKCVWAQIALGTFAPGGGPGVGAVDGPTSATAEDLMEMWAAHGVDTASAACPQDGRPTVVVTIADLPVDELVAAKTDLEDLLRELQLMLLHHDDGHGMPDAVVSLAGRLDSAARALDSLRLQIRGQALRASELGHERVTLVLTLSPDLAPTVAHYRDAVEEADVLVEDAALLIHADVVHRFAATRRHYLDEIIEQLSRHA